MKLYGQKLCSKEFKNFMKWSLSRKKEFHYEEQTELKRVLNIFDLTFLGIGSMLGMGVYIVIGNIAKRVGPAAVLSYIIAGFTCTLSALCYAEFAGRTPGTGSAYAYCYITIGEFIAFILGWNLCLEFVIGTATLARGLSGYLDSLANGAMADFFKKHMPMHVSFLSSYPDFFSFLVMLIFTGIVCAGVKESTTFNNVFVVINLATIAIVIIVGFINAKKENWEIKPAPGRGSGGFMPYGFQSVMEGAATCFYTYTGFDTVATTGGEARNPQRTIPLALVISIMTALGVYTGIAITFTLMWPYYTQDDSAPYPYVLEQIGWTAVKWVVVIGAASAVTGCLLASTFGMARIVYSIAVDGLIPKSLAKINKYTRVPVRATIVAGILTGIIAVLFDTDQLIDMTSLGTLMAYTMVAICVLVLRYENDETLKKQEINDKRGLLNRLCNYPDPLKTATSSTCAIAKWGTLFLFGVSVALGCVLAFMSEELYDCEPLALTLAVLFFIIFIITLIIIGRQPQSSVELIFKVKPVPLLPAVSMLVNTYLTLKLNSATWVRFLIWLIVGLVVYFGYGIMHSEERKQKQNDA